MQRIGLIGLGTMGANLALNFADNGAEVAVFNRTTSVTHDFVSGAGSLAERLVACETLEDLVAALPKPRSIVLMVPAGGPVDAQIAALTPLLDQGDVLIDAGNANFHETRRREAALSEAGFNFVGMGVSGGSEGARHGPAIMIGGREDAIAPLIDLIKAISAKFEGAPCAAHLGPDGAGHFVKTVHNGIEYADMQVIAEVYGLLRDGAGLAPGEIGRKFTNWNEGVLKSYLTEISGEVLSAIDPATGRPMVDMILDRAGQKGTGRWTLIEALTLGQSATTIEAAVAARSWSAGHELRQTASSLLGTAPGSVDLSDEDLESAMLAARIIGYAQGFALLDAASQEYEWALDFAQIAEIWRAGCIIRSALLDDFADAFRAVPPHGHLMLNEKMVGLLKGSVPSLRRVVAAAAMAGLPAPALSSALSYFDTLRQSRGTTDLVQGQRDFFGAHSFERIDGGSGHHGPWR